jgi:hypothetical protein
MRKFFLALATAGLAWGLGAVNVLANSTGPGW